MKGIHRVAAGTKTARQMNHKAKLITPRPSQEVEAWNKRVDEAKAAKKQRKMNRKN